LMVSDQLLSAGHYIPRRQAPRCFASTGWRSPGSRFLRSADLTHGGLLSSDVVHEFIARNLVVIRNLVVVLSQGNDR
jgi:hypothetical protein